MPSIEWQLTQGTISEIIRIGNTSSSISAGSQFTCMCFSELSPTSHRYPYSIYSVSVRMGNVDITSTAVQRIDNYNNTYVPYFVIDIPSVTDNLLIVVDMRNNPTLSWNLTGCQFGFSSQSTCIWWAYTQSTSSTTPPYHKLVADTGYDLHNANVSIIMNGVDVTSQYWSNPPEGTQEVDLLIGAIDGNLSVSIQAVSTTPRTVTLNLTHAFSSNQATSVQLWDDYRTTLTPDTGFNLNGAFVEVLYGGNPYPSAYDSETHEIYIPKVSANIQITVVANENPTFRFYNSDGSILLYSRVFDKLSTMKVEIQGTTRLLTLNDGSYSYQGSSIPSGKVFAGYSSRAGSSLATYSANFELIVNLTQSTDFYEVIVDEQAIGDMMLNLYRNSAENERVDKTNYIAFVNSLTGTFKDVTSVTSPSIIIEYETINFNYVYIPILNRYYFVEEVISVKNRLWQIRLKVDVLMSYKDTIKNQSGLIGRNQNDYNLEVIDGEMPVENAPLVDVENETTIFSTSNLTTVLLDYYK